MFVKCLWSSKSSNHFHTHPAFTCSKSTIETLERAAKLTIRSPERCQWGRSGVFIVKFEHILHLTLVFLFLTFNM